MPLTDSDRLRNLLAQYVRNVDAGDHASQAELFTDDAAIRVLVVNGAAEIVLHGPVIGGKAFAAASAALRAPQAPDWRSRHCALDALIDIEEAEARLTAQFVVVRTERTDAGEAQSMIAETGDYRIHCRRSGEVWLISSFDICIDAFPQSS